MWIRNCALWEIFWKRRSSDGGSDRGLEKLKLVDNCSSHIVWTTGGVDLGSCIHVKLHHGVLGFTFVVLVAIVVRSGYIRRDMKYEIYQRFYKPNFALLFRAQYSLLHGIS